ncbi:MAG: GerAB/ArcD/ProY family transporter [Limnochordia bacterium]|jgi:spore germination protein KB
MAKLEDGQIKAKQMLAMLIMIRIVPITITFPTITGNPQPREVWFANLISTLVALLILLLVVRLGAAHPGKTIIEYSQTLLGPVLGKAAGLLLIAYWLHIAATTARTLGEAYTVAIMPETPIEVFMMVMVFLGANAARHGIEIVGRMSDNALWLILLFAFSLLILPFGQIDFQRLKPLWDSNLTSLLRTMGTTLAFFMEMTVIGMVIPYITDKKETTRHCIYGVTMAGLLIVSFSAVLVAAFGPTVQHLSLPAYSLARLIEIATFFERVEAIPMGAWTLSSGLKLALFLWASALGLAQVFNLQRYQQLIYPLAILTTTFGALLYESVIDLDTFLELEYYGLFSLLLNIGLLCLLTLLTLIKGGTPNG